MSDRVPNIAPDAFVAPGVVIVGDVHVLARASVWYTSVLRGDNASIVLGEGSNLQDGCVVHADAGFPTTIGARVTIGHRAVVHGATVEDDVLIGMGAVLMNGCVIKRGSLVAAGAVVAQGTEIPPRSLVAGVPGKIVRELRDSEFASIVDSASNYVRQSLAHAEALRSAR
jgi:carbonic anhydrase/acetyltransferase-like protein (isoleucine patch superfamily)